MRAAGLCNKREMQETTQVRPSGPFILRAVKILKKSQCDYSNVVLFML